MCYAKRKRYNSRLSASCFSNPQFKCSNSIYIKALKIKEDFLLLGVYTA